MLLESLRIGTGALVSVAVVFTSREELFLIKLQGSVRGSPLGSSQCAQITTHRKRSIPSARRRGKWVASQTECVYLCVCVCAERDEEKQ